MAKFIESIGVSPTPHPPQTFFVIKYFIFHFIFYVKTATPPEKSQPYLSQQPPSEILRFEDWDPVKCLLFENLGSTSPPPPLY